MTKVYCHTMIKETAIGMAHKLFANLAKDNQIFTEWKRNFPDRSTDELERRFVKMMWPKLVEEARSTLTKMLRGPLDSVLKDQIADALIKDNILRQGRRKAPRQRVHLH